MNRPEAMLQPDQAIITLINCMKCENLKLCRENHWVITCDKDGKTCDNYEIDEKYCESNKR